jgi:hypothetical protein
VTSQKYWHLFDVVRGDLDAAIKSNTAHLKIHALAAADREIFDKYNRFAEFWTLTTSALQTAFFISFGRLFDTRRDSASVIRLIDATIANPFFFSKAALRESKRELSRVSAADPPWLSDCIKNAWEPNAGDLDFLRSALQPHAIKFKTIYQPIRHRVYAHRSTEDAGAIAALFEKTLITDIAEILRFLDTLLEAVRHLAWNGVRPDLTNFAHYEKFVRDLDRDIEAFICQLP